MSKWSPTMADMKKFMADPDYFRRSLFIDAQGNRQKFVPEPWQDENLKMLDPLWRRAAGFHDEELPKFAYLGRPKGHSKTTDEAMQLVWAMAFSKRRITGLAVASARDQAQFIKDGVFKLLLHNEWLKEILEIQTRSVINRATGSKMDIASGEEEISQGSEPDFILIDELTHWDSLKLWQTMMSSSDKRKHCCLIVMTNAGFKGRWHWPIRQTASKSKDWIFRDFDGPVASWCTPDVLERQRENLHSEKAWRRLWLNEWQDEASDELSKDDIAACIKPDLRPMRGDEEGYVFIGGLDLSTKKHRSALVVLAANRATQKLRLAYCRNWKADPKTKLVDLPAIRQEIIDQNRRFGMLKVLFDPAQAILMSQDCAAAGVRMEEMNFSSAKNLTLMANTLLDVFNSRQIELYNDTRLIDDLVKLNIVERGLLGFKIEAEEDSTGHADTAYAFSIALPEAVRLSGIKLVRPFVDRALLQTADDIHRRLEELERTGTEPSRQALVQDIVSRSFIGSDANHSGKICPWCRRIIKSAACECGKAFVERDKAAMALEECGISLEEDAA